jgi:hypothetical protein
VRRTALRLKSSDDRLCPFLPFPPNFTPKVTPALHTSHFTPTLLNPPAFVNGFILVIVANVPEGLPATVTSLLTLTALRLRDRNVLIKRTDIIENLGVATIIARWRVGGGGDWFAREARSKGGSVTWMQVIVSSTQTTHTQKHARHAHKRIHHPQRQDRHPDPEPHVCRQHLDQPGAARGRIFPAAAAGAGERRRYSCLDLLPTYAFDRRTSLALTASPDLLPHLNGTRTANRTPTPNNRPPPQPAEASLARASRLSSLAKLSRISGVALAKLSRSLALQSAARRSVEAKGELAPSTSHPPACAALSEQHSCIIALPTAPLPWPNP